MLEHQTSFVETDTIQNISMKYFPSCCQSKYLSYTLNNTDSTACTELVSVSTLR